LSNYINVLLPIYISKGTHNSSQQKLAGVVCNSKMGIICWNSILVKADVKVRYYGLFSGSNKIQPADYE